MSKIKFIGKSDDNFTNGKIYELYKIDYILYYNFETWIKDNKEEIRYIPYSSIYTFNDNWEVVNE